MTITYKKGCLLKALKEGEVDYILHQTNDCGVMGSGIAKQIKEQFPKAYEAYMSDYIRYKSEVLKGGTIGTISEGDCVFNLTAQSGYGRDGKRYTNYGALAKCLSEVYFSILQDSPLHEGKTVIGIPYQMSSNLGGADWGIVLELVEHLLGWADVYIYHLGDLK